MPEEEIIIETYVVKMRCYKCGTGEMIPSGNTMLMSDPPQLQHKCNNAECLATANFSERYPMVRHRVATAS